MKQLGENSSSNPLSDPPNVGRPLGSSHQYYHHHHGGASTAIATGSASLSMHHHHHHGGASTAIATGSASLSMHHHHHHHNASSATIKKRRNMRGVVTNKPSRKSSSFSDGSRLSSSLREYVEKEQEGNLEERQVMVKFPSEIAEKLNRRLSQNGVPLGLKVTPASATGRHWTFQLDNCDMFSSNLFDLPCFIESFKTLDGMRLYKSGDVSQILCVKRGLDEPACAHTANNSRPHQVAENNASPSGLTPATKSIRKRRFREGNVYAVSAIMRTEDALLTILENWCFDLYEEEWITPHYQQQQMQECASETLSLLPHTFLDAASDASDLSDQLMGIDQEEKSLNVVSSVGANLSGKADVSGSKINNAAVRRGGGVKRAKQVNKYTSRQTVQQPAMPKHPHQSSSSSIPKHPSVVSSSSSIPKHPSVVSSSPPQRHVIMNPQQQQQQQQQPHYQQQQQQEEQEHQQQPHYQQQQCPSLVSRDEGGGSPNRQRHKKRRRHHGIEDFDGNVAIREQKKRKKRKKHKRNNRSGDEREQPQQPQQQYGDPLND